MIPGKLVYLRSIEREDLVQILKWRNDPATYRYLIEHSPISLSRQELWYESLVKQEMQRSAFWFMVNTSDDIPIGVTWLTGVDWRNSNAEWGFYVGEVDYRKRGHSVEAAVLLLDFAFYHLGLQRIYCYVLHENAAALGLNQRLGFVEEGTLRNHVFHEGRYKDLVLMGLSMPDYESTIESVRARIEVFANRNQPDPQNENGTAVMKQEV